MFQWIHIIDLNKTVAMIEDAAGAMKQIAKSGKKILFVATKKEEVDFRQRNLTYHTIHRRITTNFHN